MTEMTATQAPPDVALCTMPATHAWGVYPAPRLSDEPDISTLRLFPFCRFHEAPTRAAADTYAAQQKTTHSVHRDSYEAGQTLVSCSAQANPVQLGAVLDAERILSLQEDVRTALRRLTALTANADQHAPTYVGNERAVLEAFSDLGVDLHDQFRVVRDRLNVRIAAAPARAEATTC